MVVRFIKAKRFDVLPVYFLASALLMLLLHLGLPGPQLVHGPWRWLGLLPVVAGIALAVAGERAFKRAGTAVLSFSEPSAVVTGGPFAFTRNPMYLGLPRGRSWSSSRGRGSCTSGSLRGSAYQASSIS